LEDTLAMLRAGDSLSDGAEEYGTSADRLEGAMGIITAA